MSPRKPKTAKSTLSTAAQDHDLQFPPEPADLPADGAELATDEPHGRRQYPRAPDPFAILTLKAGDNALHLGKSDKARAYFIRFDKNPNEGREPDDPHPVLKTLKENGYAWRQSPGGGMAWKKPWEDGQYSHREDQEARSFARQIAEELGGHEQGMGR